MHGQPLKTNAPMPEFSGLKGVDGKTYASSDFSGTPVLVIVFSCNHCPYVQAYEDRMIAFQREYESRGVRFVAINSNDTVNYPDDDFAGMVKRASAKGFNYIYVRDDDQSVAEKFGATHTPQFFVFSPPDASGKRHLRYSGKMDDNWQQPAQVKERYLKKAVDELLAGRPVSNPETFSIGCTIKWR